MNRYFFRLLVISVVLSISNLAGAQSPNGSTVAWTRAQAMQELTYYPNDLYLQFVAMQLSTDPQSVAQVEPLLPQPMTRRQIGNRRNGQVNLYSIFSGSLAVQESLQLDAMTDDQPKKSAETSVSIDSLSGPTVKSHPWLEMLGDQDPKVSGLAECVPDDHLFIRFDSVSKLLQMREFADLGYVYAMGQSTGSARSAGTMSGLQKQWMMETSALLEPLYDTAFAEVAITSSDLFFGEGTDATLIMRLTQPTTVRVVLAQLMAAQMAQHPDAKMTKGTFLNIPFTHVTTPDRSIHVFAADPTDDLHIRSNSRVALERILRTILNKPEGAEKIQRLSDTDEFRYIRTLMPLGAEDENGFVYMSDPFIRNLIGPQKKLTQRNRLVCRSRLQLLRHAQLLYRTQHGSRAKSIEELRDGDCLGNSESPMELVCPDGGEYSLIGDGEGCRCSHHGSPEVMVPCCEIPVSEVPKTQADEYRQFVDAYSQYWRTFFDPIAVRVRVQPDETRVETIVLPLINNSIYTGMTQVLGGKPEQLDSLPVPDSNIASLALKLDKRRLLEQWGIENPVPVPADELADEVELPSPSEFSTAQIEQSLKQIGLAIHNFHSTFKQFPPTTHWDGKMPAEERLSWRVQILPYLGEQSLFEKFHLNEPWDSKHNLPLADEIPAVLAAGSAELAAQGKTRFVFPNNPKAIYRGPKEKSGFRDVTDGTSNTLMVLVADDEHAVPWTKPVDLAVDLSHPRQGLFTDDYDDGRALMSDGAVVRLPETFSDELVAHLITRAGNETIREPMARVRVQTRDSGSRRYPIFMQRDRLVKELALDRFLHQGIGNQIAFHLCDGQPLVDFNVSRMVGMFAGQGQFLSPDASIFGVLAMAINTPVYLSVPVEDAAIVDDTLEKLDHVLARLVRRPDDRWGWFLRIEEDAFQFSGVDGPKIRGYAFRFGPITWRFYWTRLDDGLYIASTPEIITDLRDAAAHGQPASNPVDDSREAHGLVRIRPEHWEKILPHFRIGWAESERHVCLNNLPPLSHAARAVLQQNDGKATVASTRQLATDVFGGPLVCPTHGKYSIDSGTGQVSCDVHGTATQPRQPFDGPPGKIAGFAESLQDVHLELTFLDDGLHAVVTIQRKAKQSQQ